MPKIDISLREFAKREGCSEGLVRDAIKNGTLVKEQDGSLNPALVGSGWRVERQRKKSNRATTRKAVRKSAQKSAQKRVKQNAQKDAQSTTC